MQSYLALLLGIVASAASAEWRRPVIKFNSVVVAGSEVVVRPGTLLDLRCEGDGPVSWKTRLAKHKRFVSRGSGNVRTFRVERPSAEFTGTYKCVYTAGSPQLTSSVHVYVKDPNRLFWTSSTSLRVVRKEGEDYLLPCLLTNPAATDLGLRMDNGTSVPPGMNFTVYRQRGILIHRLHPGFNADYVCTAKVNGVERTSKAFSINVIQKLRFPPYVLLETEEYVRIVGEELKIRCTTHNPNFNYNVTWQYTTKSKPTIEERVRSSGENRLDIQSILTIPAVNLTDTGNISCTGTNEAGLNSSTTYLLVVDKAYIRLLPQLSPKLAHKGLSVEVNEGEDLELTVLIEAYPHITEHRWHTPTSPNTSTQEHKLIRYNNRYHATLQLKRMNAQEQGQYTFYARSNLANASIAFQVQMYQRPVAVVRWENITTLTCTSFGYPAPRIIWYQCFGIRPTCNENTTGLQLAIPLQAPTVEVQREEYGAVEVESVLTVGPSSRRMTVECVAFNLVGVSSDTFAMEVSDKLFTSTLTGAAGILAILLVLLVFLLYKYKQKPRYEIRWQIIEARDGNNYTFIDPTQLPYNEKWEFPRDKLRLGKILGAGAFGKVVEATAYGLGVEDKVLRVAVKMLKASAHSDEREALMSELKILSHLGHHKNIVNLLGACTYGGPVLVITEYCSLGDLLNFLRQKAETFENFVMNVPDVTEDSNDYKNVSSQRKFIRSDSGISSTSSSSYLEMRPASQGPNMESSPDSVSEETGDWPPDIDDLLRFSFQVAQGLDFLAAKNCIHRDVAARNVLLTDHRVAKICDFGLARDIMNDSNYVVKGNARLPVKWMAPESIFDCVYTVQSDVWSYGILLWEIFSLGKSPYPSMAVDSRFYKMMKRGYQMCQPNFAPAEIYSIMKMCWNLEPTERPMFSKISQMIERLLGDQPEQEQLIYQNVQQQQQQVTEGEVCDKPKCCDGPCDRSCDHEEEEQPLMKTNNYQFC
ncbi:macrophage colony-stimulating factor 1 receptor [Sebastes umbrosus]|uniref:macrophage colony-stimulating factor 1 receptor n=1 Tax=Sebastes umbrosus TaxID=72105 RepID=UPI0018A0087F|nr:macrophage colony-stimulating factor 1 receptor [Sebastes umbrosus]XP_037635501.1 macrophage colony-stimulating factor 1 receptor [Sebastes umbrosus]